MTPKEFDFMCEMIVHSAKAAYGVGHADGEARKPLNEQQFRLSKENRLRLKTELEKHLRKR